MSRNLLNRGSRLIERATPMFDLILKRYLDQINEKGKLIASYSYENVKGFVQNTKKKEISQINSLTTSNSLTTFYISTTNLSTTDRVIKKGVDFIIFNDIQYKISSVLEDFGTGWLSVEATEDIEV